MRRKSGMPALLSLGLLGCGAGWHRPPDLEPRAYPAHQQVQVWQGGSVRRWQAVRITPDSISGILFTKPADCDSCRLALPRAAVDSIRLGEPVDGFWKTFGLVITGFFGALIIICRDGCPNGG